MGNRFVVLVLFVGLVGICFCGCENQGQKVERLIKELKHRKAKVRANAAGELFNPSNAVKGAVPALIPLLQDEDATVRTNAIYSLGCIGESSKNARPSLSRRPSYCGIGAKRKPRTLSLSQTNDR